MWWYLAGPIDLETDGGAGWRDELKRLCRGPNNISFFDPVPPYYFNNLTEEVSQYIYEMNMMALERSDGVVVRLIEGQTSVGTPIEMNHAMLNDKKMIIITNMKKSVYIKYLSIRAKMCSSVQEAYGHILSLENPVPEELRNLRVGK